MANIIATFSRLARSGLSALLDLPGRGRLYPCSDGPSSSSSSVEPTRRSALDDYLKIMGMLSRIQAVLEDAEERVIQNRSLKLWLLELRLLAYDIDDVIDLHEYDVLIAQMKARAIEESYHRGKGKEGYDELHHEDEKWEGHNILASSSFQVPTISDGMAEKLREIRERWDEIEKD